MPSYQVAVSCEVSPSGNHEAALSDLRNFLTPAPIREIEAWLAELSVIVARRPDDTFADELRVSAYAARLGKFPADVVRSVLMDATYKFWPTWDELEKRCSAMAGPRVQMISALERGPLKEEPPRRPPTEEEKTRIKNLVAELFPNVSPEWQEAAVADAVRGNCIKAVDG
jgi:hypothetical protein